MTIKKKATKKATKKKVSKRRSNPSLKSNSSKEIHGAILSTTTLSEIEAKIFVLTDFLEQEKREIEESNTNDIRAARFNKLISILEILNHNVEEMDAQLSQVLDYYQID